MSSLTSSSTNAEVRAAYVDNASYLEDESVAKAKIFITACRILLLKIPTRAAHGKGGEIEMDPSLIQKEMQAAQTWVAGNPDPSGSSAAGGGGVKFLSFEGFRD